MLYILSMAMTVAANIIYHFCQKEIKADANPLVSLFFTYVSGIILTVIAYPFFYGSVSPLPAVRQLNWASYALGFGIVGLELGFLLVYRAGWNISIAALYSNVLVTLVLLPIGYFFYKDALTLRHAFGAILAIAGLVLLGKR